MAGKFGQGIVNYCVARTFQNVVAPLSDYPKMQYFWKIRHLPIEIFEESEEHKLLELYILEHTYI